VKESGKEEEDNKEGSIELAYHPNTEPL
jgi:hypothetical protein